MKRGGFGRRVFFAHRSLTNALILSRQGRFPIRGGIRARFAESYRPPAHNVNWWFVRAKRSNRVRVAKEVVRERKGYPLPL
jgi:hypothetical protein